MLLIDEQHVIKWLSQYGTLPRTQIIRMLQKPPIIAEKIIGNLLREHMIFEQSDGDYLGLDPLGTPDQRMITAIWVLLEYIDQIDPMAHYPASYPAQIYFLKHEIGYEILVFYEAEKHLIKLLQPQADTKYIFVIPNIALTSKLQLPRAPVLFATVDYNSQDAIPQVLFYSAISGGN